MPPASSPALKDRARVILPLRGKGGEVLQIGVRYAGRGIHPRSHLLCSQVINRHLISTRFQPGGPGSLRLLLEPFQRFFPLASGGGGRETVETVGRIAWHSAPPG